MFFFTMPLHKHQLHKVREIKLENNNNNFITQSLTSKNKATQKENLDKLTEIPLLLENMTTYKNCSKRLREDNY